MKRIETRALIGFVLTVLVQTAGAWSSPASKTQTDIRYLVISLELYRDATGEYPDPNDYRLALQRTDLWHFRESEPLRDRWGHPLVYRLPGKHGDFDVYSVGPDGIDNDGRLDDVSSWAGVNDGFHWKETWPRGRLALRLGFALAAALCLLAIFWPWRIVMPVAGMAACVSAMLGCNWLMHPGFVTSRNAPLRLVILVSAAVCFALFALLLLAVLKQRLARRSQFSPLTETISDRIG